MPPPAPEPARRFPRWLLIALPIVLVLCLAALAGGGYFAYRQGRLPFLRPPTPTATPAPTLTPTPEATPVAQETVAPAQMALAPSAVTLKVGDPLTLTLTITNTSGQPWTQMEYRLLGSWEPVLEVASSPGASAEELPAGQGRSVTFTFTARQQGSATLKVLVLWKTGGDRPAWNTVVSEEVTIHVSP